MKYTIDDLIARCDKAIAVIHAQGDPVNRKDVDALIRATQDLIGQVWLSRRTDDTPKLSPRQATALSALQRSLNGNTPHPFYPRFLWARRTGGALEPLGNHGGLHYQCGVCGDEFATTEETNEHYNTAHNEEA